MDLGLKGRLALVTGASAGLGFAAAETLAKEGTALVINGRDEGRLRAAADRIKTTTGVLPKLAVGDISKEEDIAAITALAGKVDILVSNTGGPPPATAIEATSDQWLEMVNLILLSAVNLTNAVLPGMIERRFGRLIYISSIGALQPIDDLIFSNTLRAGISGYCKTVSNNYARHGITANAVCPGYTATERLTHLAEARAEASGRTVAELTTEFSTGVPAGRLGEPGEPAALITFLASQQAAYITGCSIPVDGGLNRSLI